MVKEESGTKTLEKGSNKLNIKVLVMIGVLAIIDLVYGLYFFDGSYFDIKDGFYMAGLGT